MSPPRRRIRHGFPPCGHDSAAWCSFHAAEWDPHAGMLPVSTGHPRFHHAVTLPPRGKTPTAKKGKRRNTADTTKPPTTPWNVYRAVETQHAMQASTAHPYSHDAVKLPPRGIRKWRNTANTANRATAAWNIYHAVERLPHRGNITTPWRHNTSGKHPPRILVPTTRQKSTKRQNFHGKDSTAQKCFHDAVILPPRGKKPTAKKGKHRNNADITKPPIASWNVYRAVEDLPRRGDTACHASIHRASISPRRGKDPTARQGLHHAVKLPPLGIRKRRNTADTANQATAAWNIHHAVERLPRGGSMARDGRVER